MNKNVQSFIKNLSFSAIANLFSTFVSILLVLIVPKVLGVTEYGLWQLFIFYAGYIGFLHFGWADGVYLRYGGKNYKDLDKPLFHSQFWLLVGMELIIAIIIALFSCFFIVDAEVKLIGYALACCCIAQLPGTFLRLLLQATNRIQEYAKNLLLEKIVHGFLVITILILGVKSFLPLVLASIISLIVSSIHVIYHCKDIVHKNTRIPLQLAFSEAGLNIQCGISLLLANLSSLLILGISRIAIQYVWGIETFAKLSLSLNVCSFIMIFINAVGVVIFPVLKQTDELKWKELFTHLVEAITFGMLIVISFFFLGKKMLLFWLPQYKESVGMLGMMFPMCIYEAKMALLYNTYFKALRKEKLLLLVNISTCVFSAGMVGIFTFWLQSLIWTCLSIVLCLAFRCWISEIILSRIVGVKGELRMISETITSIIFILLATVISNVWIGLTCYTIAIIIFYFVRKKSITNSITYFKILITKR